MTSIQIISHLVAIYTLLSGIFAYILVNANPSFGEEFSLLSILIFIAILPLPPAIVCFLVFRLDFLDFSFNSESDPYFWLMI